MISGLPVLVNSKFHLFVSPDSDALLSCGGIITQREEIVPLELTFRKYPLDYYDRLLKKCSTQRGMVDFVPRVSQWSYINRRVCVVSNQTKCEPNL